MGHLNLSVKDHVKAIKAILRDEDFVEKLLENPAEALAAYEIRMSEDDIHNLPDDLTCPSVTELSALITELTNEGRRAEFPFEVINVVCNNSD